MQYFKTLSLPRTCSGPQLTPSGMSVPSSPPRDADLMEKATGCHQPSVLSVTLGNCYKPRFSPIKLGEVSKCYGWYRMSFCVNFWKKSTHTITSPEWLLIPSFHVVENWLIQKQVLKRLKPMLFCSRHNTGGM